jgi:anti-sigma B factor antagonist
MTDPGPLVTVPMPLRIAVNFPSPGNVRMAVAGEIDLATGPILSTRLLAVMREHHPVVVEVDLGKVTFLDCTGISVFVAARAAAVSTRCELWVTRPQGLVSRVLDVTGLLTTLTAPAVPDDPAPPRLNRWRPRFGRRAHAAPAPTTALAA